MAKSYSTIMLALAFIASFLVTPSLASLSIARRQEPGCQYNGTADQSNCNCQYNGTADQSNFTLLAVIKSDDGIQMQLALVSDGSSNSSGLIGVSSLPLSATIVLIRRIFCRPQTM